MLVPRSSIRLRVSPPRFQKKEIVQRTQSWVKDYVCKLNLCPFAKTPFEENTIRYSVCTESELQNIRYKFQKELEYMLNADATKEVTSLFICPHALRGFQDFLFLSDDLQDILSEMDEDHVFQLASFHPHFVYQNAAEWSITNFSSRSPFPIFHLLREDSVTEAADTYGRKYLKSIPQDNINRLGTLGWRRVSQYHYNPDFFPRAPILPLIPLAVQKHLGYYNGKHASDSQHHVEAEEWILRHCYPKIKFEEDFNDQVNIDNNIDNNDNDNNIDNRKEKESIRKKKTNRKKKKKIRKK